MAVTAAFYSLFFQSAMNKEVDLDSDTIKCMLCTSSYSPNQDTHRYKSSVTNECSGSGYTAGGATVTGVAFAYDAGTNKLSFDMNDVQWAAATLIGSNAPRYAVLYDATPGSDATRPLIGYVDFGGSDYAPNGGPLNIQWPAGGVGVVTVSTPA